MRIRPWHVPAFFDPNLPHHTMPMSLVLLVVVFFGVFMGFVFNRAGESVLATMAAHVAAVFGVAAGVITIASRTRRQRVPSLTDGGVVNIAR